MSERAWSNRNWSIGSMGSSNNSSDRNICTKRRKRGRKCFPGVCCCLSSSRLCGGRSRRKRKKKKGRKCFPTRVCCSCCQLPRYLNSIFCGAVCLCSISCVIMLAIGLYLLISGSIWNINYNNSERVRKFEKMSIHMDYLVGLVKYSVTDFEGIQRTFAKLIVEDNDLFTSIALLLPLMKNFVEKYGTFEFTLGMWLYQNSTETTKTYYSLEWINGEIVYYNTTNAVYLDVEYPVSLNGYTNTSYMINRVEDFFHPDDATYSFYSSYHSMYDYWIGNLYAGDGFTPYMSYSVGSGVLKDIGDKKNTVYATNPWFGTAIKSFSDYLRKITPSDSVSYFVDLGRDYMLAVSDDVPVSMMADTESFVFYSPLDYEVSDVVSKTYRTILEDPELLRTLREEGGVKKDPHQITVDSTYDVLVSYIRERGVVGSSGVRSEWLLINAKTHWKIQESMVIQSIVLSLLLIDISVVLCGCWCCFIARARVEISNLVTGMNRTQNMELEKVKFRFSRFSFFEIGYIQTKFLSMVEILKEYSRFLPENLMPQDESDSDNASSDHSSDPPSSTSLSNSVSGDAGSRSFGSDHLSYRFSQEVTLEEGCLDKFRLGVSRKEIIVLYIVFGYENMCQKIDRLYETILTGRRSGLFYIFGFESLSICILNENRIFFAVNMMKSIQQSLESSAIRGVRFFVCSDMGFYGNLGNENHKKFCLGGPIIRKCREMARRAPLFIKTLVCERSAEKVRSQYTVRMVDFDIYEIGEIMKVEENEWMYEIEQQQHFKRWNLWNEGIDLFHSRHYREAREKFERFQKLHLCGKEGVVAVNNIEEEKALCVKWMNRAMERLVSEEIDAGNEEDNLITEYKNDDDDNSENDIEKQKLCGDEDKVGGK